MEDVNNNNNNANPDAGFAGEDPPPSTNNNSMIPPRSLFGRSEFTPQEKTEITKKLREKLPHEFLLTRPGTFGGMHRIACAFCVFDHSQYTCVHFRFGIHIH